MSFLTGLRHRVRELVRPSEVARELDEELRDHYDHERKRQIDRGLGPDAAERAVRLRAGRLDLAREAVAGERTGHLVADLARDLRAAMRAIRRAPGFAAAVVVSLALGIGGTTAIFSVVYGVLIRPLAFDHADELHLVRVWWNDFSGPPSPADYFALRDTRSSSGPVGAYFFPDGGFALAGRGGPELVEGGIITPDLLKVLRVAPRLGGGFTTRQEMCEILVSDALWHRRLGGTKDAIGRGLTLDGQRCAVVGVMPAGFNLPGQRNGDVWAKAQLKPPTRRGPFFLTTLARVPASSSVETTEARITTAVTPLLRDRYGIRDSWRYGLRPLRDALVGDVRETLLLTFAAVSLVLIIAMANVANLLLARGTVRTRELAVRASLGAGRGRLARQLLTESAVLGVAGGAFGVLLARLLVDIARTAGAQIVPRMSEVRVGAAIVAFGCALGLCSGLLAGVLPVVRLPWTRLGDWLREGGRTGESIKHGRTRRALVVAEIALTLTVVTSAALLVKSLIAVEGEDPGFRHDGVLSFRLSLPDHPYEDEATLAAFVADLTTRLASLPGVASVAYAASLPPNLLDFTNNYTLEGSGRDGAGTNGVAEWNVVSRDFFDTLKIPVTRGRAFVDTDRPDAPPVAVVNESFVQQHFQGLNPIGKRLKGGEWDPKSPWKTIVGVVRDLPYASGVWGGSHPMVYQAFSQSLWLTNPFVIVRTAGDPAASLAAVRAAVTAVDGGVPLRDVATMTERVRRSTTIPRFRGLLFSFFAVLALAIALTGIYGIMAHHVNQRRRETAIRRALGATSQQMLASTLGAGLRLALVGIGLGTGAALAVTRSMAALLYRVDPRDPTVLAGVAALLAATAVIACIVPALRAASIDPAAVLRDE
jgi:putative ABC transport system permease protein